MKYLVPVLLLILFPMISPAQEQDSIFIGTTSDSMNMPADSIAADTSRRGYDVDTVIYSSASDSLIFLIDQKKMKIYGNGELQYKNTELKSANITIDFNTNEIEATGVQSDTGLTGPPKLNEAGELYEGAQMKYNFKTTRGYITAAETENEGSFYTGYKIKKVDSETYFVEDGIFTSCEIDTPHYHFYSPQMKVIHQQEVITQWVWLFFGGVPFPVPLPFAVLPMESGRRSGILPPAYGNDNTYGRYFSRFGYFWAISDYMDINLTADYYTRGSYNLSSLYRYVKRYSLSGNLEGGYSYFIQGEGSDPDKSERTDWRIKWSHNQNIDPTLRFDANLEFISGNYLQRNVTDYNELLRNEIISNATLFKSWDESGNSLSLSYQRRQEIESGNISEVLPNLTFGMSQKYPFKREDFVGEQRWYELVGYTYTGQLQNNRNKTEGIRQVRGGIQHNINLNASPKLGYFNITPSIRYQERWYNKRVEKYAIEGSVVINDVKDIKRVGKYAVDDSVVTNDVKDINFVRTFGLGISTSTKFYGMFQPGILGISALRHTVNPTISYNYQPNFSEPGWGYYGSYLTPEGNTVYYDKFEREIFGGVSSQEQQNIALNLSNIFEIKTTSDPTDTTSKENKIQLLNLGFTLSYNFAADSLKLSDLAINYRTQISDYFSFDGSSTFSPYDYSDRGRINRYLTESGRGFLRMTNFSFSVSTTLSGERIKSALSSPRDTLPESEFELGSSDNRIYKGIYDEKEADFAIPWDVSLTYNYNINQEIPTNKTRYSNVSGGINFNLTPNWKFSFTGSYDLVSSVFAAPQVRISRDLHCWIMNFTWNPIGTYSGYRFEIRVKAPQLQDLKLTKRDDFFSGK